jgi:uncharacterized RDD family membrane protein YckC
MIRRFTSGLVEPMAIDAAGMRSAAGPLVRALALAIDELMRWSLIVAAMVVWFQIGSLRIETFGATVIAVYWLYGASFEAFARGQTPGKRALRIRTIRVDGTPIGFGAASVRNVALLIDALPFAYVGGLFVMMIARDFRRVGDLAAHTQVVYADDLTEPWPDADRGCEAVRAAPGLFYGAWSAAAIPLFIVIAIALWDSPGVAGVVIWWFKPLYERLPMWIYAQRARGAPASVGLAIAQWRLLVRGLGAMLTYRRLAPRRSFDAPIDALEGLQGSRRRGRAMVMHRDAQPAVWATIVGVHIEAFISTVAEFALWCAIPSARLELDSLLAISAQSWFGWASNLIYLGAIGLVGPFYAAAGCALYLRRRASLERARTAG